MTNEERRILVVLQRIVGEAQEIERRRTWRDRFLKVAPNALDELAKAIKSEFDKNVVDQ